MRETQSTEARQWLEAVRSGRMADDGRDHGTGMGGTDTLPSQARCVRDPATGLCQHCPDRLRKSASTS